jgi:hypothetical protein
MPPQQPLDGQQSELGFENPLPEKASTVAALWEF